MPPHQELDFLTLILSHAFTSNIKFQCNEPQINGMPWVKVFECLLSQFLIQYMSLTNGNF